jgi:hypothetical protein
LHQYSKPSSSNSNFLQVFAAYYNTQLQIRGV